jgi:hypothetical protein
MHNSGIGERPGLRTIGRPGRPERRRGVGVRAIVAEAELKGKRARAYPKLRGSTSATPPIKWLLYVGLHFTADQLKNFRSDFEQFGGSIRIVALGSCQRALLSELPQLVVINHYGTPWNPSTRHFWRMRGNFRANSVP